MTGLMTALSMEGSSSSDNDKIVAGASPGYDAIVGVFSPLLTAVGMAGSLFEDYSPSIFDPVEEFLNGLVTDGMIEIVNQIMPLDSESEEMIRNATKGDVDPEIEEAAENMSEELNFTSKEVFIESVIDLYNNESEEVEGNTTYQKQNFYAGPNNKIALLIGQGGGDDFNITNAIHNDMTKLYHLLDDEDYTFIRGNFNSTKTSSYYNWDFLTDYYQEFMDDNYTNVPYYLDNQSFNYSYEATIDYLMKMLGQNLTGNETVFICIAGHGPHEEDTNKDVFTTNDVLYGGESNDKSIKYDFIGERLDNYTLVNGTANYEKMVVIVHACYSGFALEPLSKNDKSKRVVITATDDDELAYGSLPLGRWASHVGFLTHFINYLDGDGYDEFWLVLQCEIVEILTVGTILGVVIGASFWLFTVCALAAAAASEILAIVLVIILLVMFIWSLKASYEAHYHNDHIYDAYDFAKKHTERGAFFGVFLSSTPRIRNKELAKKVKL